MGHVTLDYCELSSAKKAYAEAHAKAEETTLGKIFKAKFYKSPPAGKKIEPFNVTEIRANLAVKTQAVVNEAFKFKTYSSDNKKTTQTFLNILSIEINDFDKKLKLLKETNHQAYSVGEEFLSLILKIQSSLKKEDFHFDDVQALRSNIRSALSLMKANEKLFEDEEVDLKAHESVFAQFLEALSYQMMTQVEGMSILQGIGRQVLSGCETPIPDDGKISETQLADYVEEAFHRMPAHDWNTPWHCFKWAISNLKEAFLAYVDNSVPGGHALYNSHDRGNVNITYGHFEVDGKKIQTHIGPGLMNDPLISEAAMAWGARKGEIQVAHTLETNEKKGEWRRVKGLKALIEKIAVVFKEAKVYFMATSHDGEIEKGKGKFSDIQTSKQFHDQLAKAGWAKQRKIENYKGFNLPEPLLSDKDIDTAITFSKECFAAALSPFDTACQDLDSEEFKLRYIEEDLNPHHIEEYNQRLCSAMLTCLNTFLEMTMLINLGKMLKENNITGATYSLVCKQCFDRGPLANATLIAFVKFFEKGTLTKKDVEQIIGLLTGRSIMGGGDRKMVTNRRQTFIDLFRIIGNKRRISQGRGDKAPIKFIPSA